VTSTGRSGATGSKRPGRTREGDAQTRVADEDADALAVELGERLAEWGDRRVELLRLRRQAHRVANQAIYGVPPKGALMSIKAASPHQPGSCAQPKFLRAARPAATTAEGKLCASFRIEAIAGRVMAGNRDLAWRRWLSIALRTLHIVGVVLAAIALLGNGDRAVAGVMLMLLSGFALFAIDLWQRPGLWREVAGAFIFVKLLALAAMLVAPGIEVFLFWLLLVTSSVVSHAPHDFRHRRILG